jgi:hypothetical protein
MRCQLLVLLLGFLAVASPSIAQKGRHAGSERSRRGRSHQPKVSKPKVTTPATPAAPTHHGTIKRSKAAKGALRKQTWHPHGWPGHMLSITSSPRPAAARAAPSSMLWQTTAEAEG